MSRIGTAAIAIPAGVKVDVQNGEVHVQGPRGSLSRALPRGISAKVEGERLRLERVGDDKQSRSLHGLARALCQGMVEGVHSGYSKRLEIVGVSYQASVEGARLKLMVGFSHPVFIEVPQGLKVECPTPVQIHVSGCDKQLVGEFAARVRRVRPPEPYKGKGVRYVGEQIIQKAGKSFVGGEK